MVDIVIGCLVVSVLVDKAVADWTDILSAILVEIVAFGAVTIVSVVVSLVDLLVLLEEAEVVAFGVVVTVSVVAVLAGAGSFTEEAVSIVVTVEVAVLAVV